MPEVVEINGYQIELYHVYPPIPDRSTDWFAALKDGDYDCDVDDGVFIDVSTDPSAYGRTKEEAIANLLEMLAEKDA